MINQKKCNICKRLFSRKWNLERHLQDIHKISINTKQQSINQEDNNYSSLPIDNNVHDNFRNENIINNIYMKMNPRENSPFSNIFSKPYPPPTNYNNGQFLPYSNFYHAPREIERKILTNDDKIRIQRALKILENYLLRFYPPFNVSRIIFYLNYRCRKEKSDEPLKEFLAQYNIGHLWPYY
jgi:hypothetical protein